MLNSGWDSAERIALNISKLVKNGGLSKPVCARLVLGDSMFWQSSGSWHMLVNLCSDFVWQRLAQLYSISTLDATFSLVWGVQTALCPPKQKSWIPLLPLAHADKQGCSWSYWMLRFLSVMSRNTKRSHAKQPRRFQVAGRYFIFISFLKKVQALLYADRGAKIKHSGRI